MRALGWLCLAGAAALLLGCGEHPQSALHPRGPRAAHIAGLWWLMFAVCAAVFLLVMGLLAVAVFRRPRGEGPPAPPGGGVRFVALGGIVMPAVVVVGLLVASLAVTVALRSPPAALTVRVIGHQFWWEVHYPELGITDANEIHIPVGEPVRVELTSDDVIHSFWVPNLGARMDMVPGRTTQTWMQADLAGVYRGQCAEFCGVQHAGMAFEVVARPRAEFDAWAAARRAPHPEPGTDPLRRGRDVFVTACGHCHVVRGTGTTARVGPDLTHLGARRTIAAGMRPNTRGELAAWIADPQAIKPGNKMPPSSLPPGDLKYLVDYLQTLK